MSFFVEGQAFFANSLQELLHHQGVLLFLLARVCIENSHLCFSTSVFVTAASSQSRGAHSNARLIMPVRIVRIS